MVVTITAAISEDNFIMIITFNKLLFYYDSNYHYYNASNIFVVDTNAYFISFLSTCPS